MIVVMATLAVTVGALAPVWSAVAIKVPRTLSDARPPGVGVVSPGFPIDFVAAVWTGDHDEGIAAAVRFLHGSAWGPWSPLGEDGAQAEGQFGTGLVSAGEAGAYQVRGVPGHARVVAINTTDGPLEEVAKLRAGSASAYPACRSRADWGADERLTTWSPDFHPAQVLTVHHTATTNDDTDPAATVRAIYRYHAVHRGWGDIGYQLLLDQNGVVYEGRSKGTTSRSCLTEGGNGSDFGHSTDNSNRAVVGAHVGGWNGGNLGVSLLGTYTNQPPRALQRSSLENVLATLASRHDINPLNTSYLFTNPTNGKQKIIPTLSGHRDWHPTECPGGALYAALPEIRIAVAALKPAHQLP